MPAKPSKSARSKSALNEQNLGPTRLTTLLMEFAASDAAFTQAALAGTESPQQAARAIRKRLEQISGSAHSLIGTKSVRSPPTSKRSGGRSWR